MIRKLLLLALVLIITTPAAMAGGYLGAGVGQSYFSTRRCGQHRRQRQHHGWKVFGGWTILKFFALEASYVDFGSIEDKSSGVTIKTEATGYDAFAVGKIPITFVEPFVRSATPASTARPPSRGAARPATRAGISPMGWAWDSTSPRIARPGGVRAVRRFAQLRRRRAESDLYMISASAAWRF